jgi:hypothetical protein
LVALAWMTTTAAMARALLVRQNCTLCLGGTKVPSKRHLLLSDRFSAWPILVSVVWATQAVPTAEGDQQCRNS